MAQARFKSTDVNNVLMHAIAADPTTQYFAAMTFQLGCAIGELIHMGVKPEDLSATIDTLIDMAVETRSPPVEPESNNAGLS